MEPAQPQQFVSQRPFEYSRPASPRKKITFQLPVASHCNVALPLCEEYPISYDLEVKVNLDKLVADDDNEVPRQIAFFKQIPDMDGVVGSLFEPLVHWVLANTAYGQSLGPSIRRPLRTRI